MLKSAPVDNELGLGLLELGLQHAASYTPHKICASNPLLLPFPTRSCRQDI